MKIYILCALFALLCMNSSNVYAQIVREGNTFSQQTTRVKDEPTKTQFTWKDSSGTQYPIYVSSNGSCFVIMTSKKTNKEYRKYLGKEISMQICKEMKITYKPKK